MRMKKKEAGTTKAWLENAGGEAVEGVAEMARNDLKWEKLDQVLFFLGLNKLLIDKLDHFTVEQRSNHEYYTAWFQYIDQQIEVV